jgi:hypothetical protein
MFHGAPYSDCLARRRVRMYCVLARALMARRGHVRRRPDHAEVEQQRREAATS